MLHAFAAKNVKTPNIDFDYEEYFLYVCCDSDSDGDDNDNDKKQTNCFESFVCFSGMISNLKYVRF